MIRILRESKQDIEKFKDKYGDELSDEFFARRKQLRSPYNDIYFWLQKNPMGIDEYLYDDEDSGWNDQMELEYFLDSDISMSTTQLRKKLKGGARKIYEDDDWKCYQIDTYEAAVYYGKHTKWCISGTQASNELFGEDYFKDYKYVVICIDKNSNKKYAVVWEYDNIAQVYNETDVMISAFDFDNDKSVWNLDKIRSESYVPQTFPQIKFNGNCSPSIKNINGKRVFYDSDGDVQNVCLD